MADDDTGCGCGCGCGSVFTIWITLIALKLFGILEMSWLLILLGPIWLTFVVVVGTVLFTILSALVLIIFAVGLLCILLPIAFLIDAFNE